jgi:hypothetical protein
MAVSDYAPWLFKNRLHLAGRPQMSSRPSLYMAATENFKVDSAHAHLAIFGGASLIVYGLVYHAGLAKNGVRAAVLLLISVIGDIAFPLGEYFAITAGADVAAAIASLIVLASGLLFVFNVVRA